MSGVRRRKARQPGKPKRASSAYFYFLSHFREEMKQQGISYRIGVDCCACFVLQLACLFCFFVYHTVIDLIPELIVPLVIIDQASR